MEELEFVCIDNDEFPIREYSSNLVESYDSNTGQSKMYKIPIDIEFKTKIEGFDPNSKRIRVGNNTVFRLHNSALNHVGKICKIDMNVYVDVDHSYSYTCDGFLLPYPCSTLSIGSKLGYIMKPVITTEEETFCTVANNGFMLMTEDGFYEIEVRMPIGGNSHKVFGDSILTYNLWENYHYKIHTSERHCQYGEATPYTRTARFEKGDSVGIEIVTTAPLTTLNNPFEFRIIRRY